MNEKNKSGNMILNAVKGEGCAAAVTAVIFVLCAVLLTYTDMDEGMVGIISAVCTGLSAFLAGFIVSSSADKGGIFIGALSGLLYAVLLTAVLFLGGKSDVFTTGTMFCFILSLAGGAVGGIFGINSKK